MLPFKLRRKLAHGARKHPWRRPAVAALSRLETRRSGGGILFMEDSDLLEALRLEAGLPLGPPLRQYLDELREDRDLSTAFETARARRSLSDDADWTSRLDRLRGVAAVYYAFLRELGPELVVETGTAAGGYTAFALAALHHNGKGELISIDLPAVAGRFEMVNSVPGDEAGYLIPATYRDRWTYRIGDAKRLLPAILAERQADVFVHDSLHTTTHMLFEYAVARALMREGAVIISDDILWNNAFDSFLRANHLTGFSPFSRPNTGVVVNRFDDYERDIGLGIQSVEP